MHIGHLHRARGAVAYYVILNRTTLGYEVRAVGFNPEAARYGGISVGAQLMLAMAISGAFAGLAGAMEVLGVEATASRRRRPRRLASASGHRGGPARPQQRGGHRARGASVRRAPERAPRRASSTRGRSPPELATNLATIIQALDHPASSAASCRSAAMGPGRARRSAGAPRSREGRRPVAAPAAAPPPRESARHDAAGAQRRPRGLAAFVGASLIVWRASGHRSAADRLDAGCSWAPLQLRDAARLRGARRLFSERSGVINIGLEGMMLTGCLLRRLVERRRRGSWVIGLLGAMFAAALLAFIHAVLLDPPARRPDRLAARRSTSSRLGITGYLYRTRSTAWGRSGDVSRIPSVHALPRGRCR